MKTLVCSTEYPPYGSGIANVVGNVVEQLRKNGIECTICSPTGPDIYLGSQELINKFGFLGLLYYWYLVSQFFNKKNAYDVVWLHNPYFVFKNPFPRCLITMHSTYYGLSHHHVGNTFSLRMYYKIVSIIERYCLGKICKTIVVTGVGQPVCEELEKSGIAKEQIVYIPNGVDISKFHPSENKMELRRKLGIPEEGIVILSVGRLTSAKQPHLMLEIFSGLEKKIDTVTLCIAGRGELFESAQKRAKKMGIRDIKFLGHVDNQKKLPELYASCDYYFMISKYEGSPLTLLEAMASGLPCIVSDIPNLRIVRDADCGLIVHLEDFEDTTCQIKDYLQGYHPEHANNARKYAVDTLNWEIITQKYYKFFGNCIKSSSGK